MNTVTLLLMFGVAVKYCYFVLQLHKNFIWAFIRIQPLTLSVFCFFCLLFFFYLFDNGDDVNKQTGDIPEENAICQ